MGKRTGRATAELCGAVIGAGFASGQEIGAFFARFGAWSWPGVAAAAGVMGWLGLGLMQRPGAAGMPLAWQGRWLAWLWRGMFSALLTATGGAMLAAGGEVAALLLPFHGARAVGMGAILLLAWYLSRHDTPMLALVSRGLILCLLGMVAVGLFLPVEESAVLGKPGGAEGILYGLCYGGFNAALAAPVMALTGGELCAGEQRRCVAGFTAVLALLLACGNGVLLRHEALQAEQLPFVMLLRPLGYPGYALAGGALFLAALTTLAACLRGLNTLVRSRLPYAALLVLSLGGLEDIVGVVYPVLGAGCFLLLGVARLQKRTKM